MLLDRLGAAAQIDGCRANLDSTTVPAKRGGVANGPNPMDRGKAGSMHYLLVDR